MRKIFILFSIFLLSCNSQNSQWDKIREMQHLSNRNDSTAWDYPMLERDINSNKTYKAAPINFGAFPVPHYKLTENNLMGGLTSGDNYITLDNRGRNLIYTYFGRNNRNSEKPNEIFFTIVVLSDAEVEPDSVYYSNVNSLMSSRNSPDCIGEGYIKTKNDRIDFVAFLTANRGEYAIVNMRL